jgi:hypothetical protein
VVILVVKVIAFFLFIRLRQDTLSRLGGTAEKNGEATAP